MDKAVECSKGMKDPCLRTASTAITDEAAGAGVAEVPGKRSSGTGSRGTRKKDARSIDCAISCSVGDLK